MTEIEQKQSRIKTLLAESNLDALLLQCVSSFAWATGGAASYINTADIKGVASLLITPTGRYLITNNIEAPRFEQEEQLKQQGWEFCVAGWHETQPIITELTQGLRLGADGLYPNAKNLSTEVASLRAALTPEEGERFRVLGRLCAAAMNDAIQAVRPGQTEYEIAGVLAQAAESRGVQAIVNLIATDERIFAFRHPLPTTKKLERYAMLVLCGRRQGLVCSITRFIHFGRLPDELRRKAEAVAEVDAQFLAATRPGRTLGAIFQQAVSAYVRVGFPNEWTRHHQGGLAGYEPRERVATFDVTDQVAVGQTYAWNPSITGAKSEDTLLVGESGNEILTAIPGWPAIAVNIEGQTIERPAILENL